MLAPKMRGIGMALVASLTLGGCYGSFNLTRKLYDWNGSFENEWATEGVFLGLVIIPVYGLFTFADALVLNSIEFWTGDHPIEMSSVHREEAGEYAVLSERRDHQLSLRFLKGEETVAEFQLSGLPGEPTRLLDADGSLLATAQTLDDGRVQVLGAGGEVVAVSPGP